MKPVTWDDVCYTGSKKTDERLEAINSELNEYETQNGYNRQYQYEESLDYLRSFMGVTQQREVVLEEPPEVESYPVSRAGSVTKVTMPPLEYNYVHEQYRESSRWIKANIDIESGYRADNLKWGISGDLQGANPNVFVEYKFNDVITNQIKAKANLVLADRLVLDGYAAYGEILKGRATVSEYDQNDRTALAVRDRADTDEDKIMDFSSALGWRFKIDSQDVLSEFLSLEDLNATVLLGYSRHEQRLTLTNGETIIDNTSSPDLGPYGGLDSSYNAKWKGPWAGAQIDGHQGKISGLFRVEYHLADYYGWGRLNLQPLFQQPKSFDHESEGHGWVMNLDLGYQLTENFSFDFIGDLQFWHTEEGVDRLFLADGSLAEERQLNEVVWDSYALMLGAKYKFN